MNNSSEDTLMREYVQRFNGIIFWPLRYSGFCRFNIKNGRVIPKTLWSIIVNLSLICFIIYTISFILWYGSSEFDIQLPEALGIVHAGVFSSLRLLNISFGTRYSGSKLIESCIKIDEFLGIQETSFLREIQFKFYTVLCILLTILQIMINILLYLVFEVSVQMHILSAMFWIWFFFNYHDYSLLISYYVFLVLRVRYLNAALINKVKVKPEYVPKQLFFHSLFWKNNYDSCITFGTRAGNHEFGAAYRMLLQQFADLGKILRFSALLGIGTVIYACFIATYQFISYAKTVGGTKTRRAEITVGWIVATWFLLLFYAQISDMFYKELEFTKLICAYSQLKPSYPAHIHKLTKNIIKTLEGDVTRISIYGIVHYNTRLILKLTASTFVYITVQLQLAIPGMKKNFDVASNTTSAIEN